MTSEELNQLITNVLENAGDQGVLSETLENLRTDYNERLTEIDNFKSTNAELTKNNETLRNVNNKFMLKLGDLSDFTNGNNPPQNQEPTTPIGYDDLIDSNGRLK